MGDGEANTIYRGQIEHIGSIKTHRAIFNPAMKIGKK